MFQELNEFTILARRTKLSQFQLLHCCKLLIHFCFEQNELFSTYWHKTLKKLKVYVVNSIFYCFSKDSLLHHVRVGQKWQLSVQGNIAWKYSESFIQSFLYFKSTPLIKTNLLCLSSEQSINKTNKINSGVI